MARSLIPKTTWARRLVYELIYLSFGLGRSAMFNVGFAPVRREIVADPAFAVRPYQIQLYAELFDQVPWNGEQWRRSACLELGAGGGGGLLYLNTRHVPRSSMGIEQSYVAAWRARRLGVDVPQGDAAKLGRETGRFDCVFCVDTLNYLHATAAAEAFRALKPAGYLLCGESFHGTPSAAREHYGRLAAAAGFEFANCHDATEGVRRSLLERSSAASFVLKLPSFIRNQLRETLFLDGSERLRLWQSGAMCFVIMAFQRPD